MKLLFLAGSSRQDSFNKKLAKLACKLAANSNVTAKFVDLADYPMPIYHGDEEAAKGLPDNAIKLKELFIESQGIFIASPEYNSGMTPLLCNALNWISRPHIPQEIPLNAFRGKVFALAAASPGGFGGMRGLVPLRLMLSNIGALVLPDQVCVPAAHTQFNKDGSFVDEKLQNMLQALVNELAKWADK
jgi:NAD(P)H-dependent FMN reductase